MTVRAIIGRLRERHGVLLRLVAAVVVLGGVEVGAATLLTGHVPANARVGGFAIGGMTPGQAEVTLNRLLVAKTSAPVHVTVPLRSVDIEPVQAGLRIDVGATLSGLTGFTLNPVQLWAHLTGQDSRPLVPAVDRGKLTAAVTTAARTLDSSVRQGSVTFSGGTTTAVASVVGTAVRVPETAAAVAAAWPDRRTVQAVSTATQPKVAADEITRATKELGRPAMSAPVKILVGSPLRATVVLQPRQYAAALSVRPDGAGRLHLGVDIDTLMTALRAAAPGVESTPVDATVRLVAGQPVVVAAVTGRVLDKKSVAASFLAALTSSTRTATVMVVPVSPKVTTATAAGWGIKGVLSTFTTHFPVNPPRTNNIKIAAATLNGTLVRPGAQFSLNATLGRRTAAKGYQRAPVIFAGRLVKDYGGGVSQVSTTTFNAAFFAGVRIDRYTPHSFYISRYPEGREATVSWPDVDQRWTNDTGHGILIKTSVSGSTITVTFLGTKVWDIEAVKGPRRNVRQPKVLVDPRPDCVPQSPSPGFDVTVTRIFKKGGSVVKTGQFNTHYLPENSVRCTHPAAR